MSSTESTTKRGRDPDALTVTSEEEEERPRKQTKKGKEIDIYFERGEGFYHPDFIYKENKGLLKQIDHGIQALREDPDRSEKTISRLFALANMNTDIGIDAIANLSRLAACKHKGSSCSHPTCVDIQNKGPDHLYHPASTKRSICNAPACVILKYMNRHWMQCRASVVGNPKCWFCLKVKARLEMLSKEDNAADAMASLSDEDTRSN